MRAAWLARIATAYESDNEYRSRSDKFPFYQLECEGLNLWYKVTEGDDSPPRLCVPDDALIKEQLMREYHEPPMVGHVQSDRCYERMRRAYYWDGMREQIRTYVSSCHLCQSHKDSYQGKRGEMAAWQVPNGPWSSVALDFAGPFPHSKGDFDSILVAVCRLTKMVHLIPCRTTDTAEQVADQLVSGVIKLHGIPDDFRSDRDKIFTSRFWGRVWERLGTSVNLSTAYHHQSAGQVERVIKELRAYLALYATKDHKEWPGQLPMCEFAFNSAYHSSIGCAPFELNYGFAPRSPSDLVVGAAPDEPRPAKQRRLATKKSGNPKQTESKKPVERADDWLERLDANLSRAQKLLEKAHTSAKKEYDRTHKPTQSEDGVVTFAPPGSYVYLRTREMQSKEAIDLESGDGVEGEMKRKFFPRFIGPYEVLEVQGHGALNRKLKLSDSLKARLKHDVFHVERLKPAKVRAQPLNLAEGIPPPATVDPEEEEPEYFVERIVNHRLRGRMGRMFRVKWTGYGSEHNTWLPERELQSARELLEEYLKKKGLPMSYGTSGRQSSKQTEQTASPATAARRSSRLNPSRVTLCVDYSAADESVAKEIVCAYVTPAANGAPH
jgi:hypothetical protein